MEKDKFKDCITSMTTSCLMAGMFSIPGCILFFYGLFSLGEAMKNQPGAMIAGAIMLVFCLYFANASDKKRRELLNELYPEE